ncbi:helix-turn-helix domain-containing protein [Cellulosimicrobium arenosum]|nr:helix-turn-helix domain-containing protein [Cellulosimicrobium arenosum]
MNATAPATPKWMSRRETADLLGVTPRTVDRYIGRGYLHATKLGTQIIRIETASVEDFLRRGEVTR